MTWDRRGSMQAIGDAAGTVAALHYAAPIMLFCCHVLGSAVSQICSSGDSSSSRPLDWTQPRRTASLLRLQAVALVASYALDVVLVIVRAIVQRGWWPSRDYLIYLILTLLLWSILTFRLFSDTDMLAVKSRRDWEFVAVFIVALPFEVLFLIYHFNLPASARQIGQAVLLVSRIVILGMLCFLYERIRRRNIAKSDEECDDPLLSVNGNPSNYNSVGRSHEDLATAKLSLQKPKRRKEVGWIQYVKSFGVFFPHLWPSDDQQLQLVVCFCFILLIIARVINVLVPRQLGLVTDQLAGEGKSSGAPSVPWGSLIVYIFLRFCQGNMGLMGAWRALLWIPVSQYTFRRLSEAAFRHIHTLSYNFHISKRTGELISAMSKGNSINTFLELIVFQILPVIFDLALAGLYFVFAFDAYFAVIVFLMTVAYIWMTIKITEWRTDLRRDMVKKSLEESAVRNDSISNYETVKYFNAEDFEFNRYHNTVLSYQKAEYKVLSSLNLLNVTQGLVFSLGLLASCLLSAYRVSMGFDSVGQFVTLLTYMAQLQQPLNFFGMYYRTIQSNLVDTERLLELFQENSTVTEAADAMDLDIKRGEIQFEHVTFTYDGKKTALDDLTFTVPAGATVALVGESGGGKSTILRLIYRFFDPTNGSIKIDGHDVRDITFDSLRRHIGVVPQDTVLFNETIKYNILYAKPDATDEEIVKAAKAAQIHDRILSFPDGYDTKVGERGLRLSGGEKQRVAIARTLLKDPKIILLDEATSSLDSITEQQIQTALADLATGRTCIVVAHRLSTITSANMILCIFRGRLIEWGTHEELIKKGVENGGQGMYYSMYQKQVEAEKEREIGSQAEEKSSTERLSVGGES